MPVRDRLDTSARAQAMNAVTAPALDIGTLLPRDLPDGRELLEEGRRVGDGLTVGVSLLCEQHGVRSEVAYRQKMLD